MEELAARSTDTSERTLRVDHARQEVARRCIRELVSIIDAYMAMCQGSRHDVQEIIDRSCVEGDATLDDLIFRMRSTLEENAEFIRTVLERRQQNFNIPDFLFPAVVNP
ncbi:hypothetical protein GUITHDRAFT_122656 [Guillardia theta CCMP2712]|uniref:Uncharacterized protein n=1 Tax=Guillardia theta (strain CCMP2712) TaxID=905079 RepID=L1I4G9_GUITC|nr:hypothetical protein GUITHDRAFT_122656 [Guillardia theta CCMP2712]EKX31141.1 hypothetical protein GUITHDRAFT_122656 [Guillardia theta CCMP2712]|eukprot:XP_005818121.1 hypothetical protein GUITHDRAFT_122656 [Guillardia theta CCMP2712]